jgi:arginase family enzyme
LTARSARRVDLIGVPIDLGAGRRGVRLGPDALRAAKLKEQLEALGCDVRDRGDVAVPRATHEEPGGLGMPRYIDVVRTACANTADAVEAALRDGAFPIVLGGDHSLATGALAGTRAHLDRCACRSEFARIYALRKYARHVARLCDGRRAGYLSAGPIPYAGG